MFSFDFRKPLVLLFSGGVQREYWEGRGQSQTKITLDLHLMPDRCQGFITDLEQVLNLRDVTGLLDSYFSTYPLHFVNNLKELKAFLPYFVYHTQQ